MKTLYWSRKPGNFLNKNTGESVTEALLARNIQPPQFLGTVREWYETLVETMYDCAQGMKKPKAYVSSTTRIILECSCFFQANVDKKHKHVGQISQFEIYVDDSLPNNEIKIVEGKDVRKVIVCDLNII